MKLITFAIPCYNSESYLHRAVDSLLPGGDDVQILIIDDGSADNTGIIADAYMEKYPDIVQVIHKENGGHGSGVNAGIDLATGLYFKVVDSDDWVDINALKLLLETLRSHINSGNAADMYITNFVYEHTRDNTTHIRNWCRHFPKERVSHWSEVKPFVLSQALLMHNIIYRTQALRESKTRLPEHTFYVDNLFAYKPLPYMKTLYYLDIDLYHYYIGRDDQSVNLKNMAKRYDQQTRVMLCMTDAYRYDAIKSFSSGLRRYMLHDLSVIMIITMFICSCGSDGRRKAEYNAMWQHILETDPPLYRYLRYRNVPALFAWMPWKMRKIIMLLGYKTLCKILKLG